jgi:hypothetical protein
LSNSAASWKAARKRPYDVGGVCSFIIDPLDLADPATCLEVEGGLGRVRLEVDELHYVNVSSINPESIE